MARIKQLSKHLINQIAAGEVIERPASVVKELVENSIDAGATKISVEITNECRNIRVADNGSGIHPDDIMLAFSKHATSKIANDEDLYDIETLGFRGEALSSIISIAKLSCTTRTKDYEYGTKVVCENSEVQQVQAGCAVGTIMDVRDLFYNIPARLKFLRNPNTEFSYIQEIVQSIAVIHPNVAIELKKNGKTVLKTTAQGELKRNLKEIFSSGVVECLKEVLKTDELSGLRISGYVSTPDFTRSSKKDYHIYINSRTVKCPTFIKSVDMAYRNLMGSGKYPFVVLNLEIPPTDVDVNVHPTKKEVRYKNTNQVFNFIMTGIMSALSSNGGNIQTATVTTFPQSSRFDGGNNSQNQTSDKVVPFNRNSEKSLDVFYDKEKDDMFVPSEFLHNFSLDNGGGEKVVQRQEISEQKQFFAPTENQEVEEDLIIGQYKNTYILIERPDGLEVVDQHIAEERFLYEKLKSEKQVMSQMLFISDVLTVSATEAEIIKENAEKFEKFGYGIEFTSDTELIFRKVPQMLAKANPREILSDILANIEGNIDGLEENILKTTACKASVKAGQKLSLWQMQEIIKKWRTTQLPYTCPHGRPINKVLSHKEIASWFQRNM